MKNVLEWVPEHLERWYLAQDTAIKNGVGYLLWIIAMSASWGGWFLHPERWITAVLTFVAVQSLVLWAWLLWRRMVNFNKENEGPPKLKYEQMMERANKEIEELNKHRPPEWG